jgi:hypothetical protein
MKNSGIGDCNKKKWGTNTNVKDDILNSFGFMCNGGSFDENDNPTYRVYKINGEFYKEFSKDDFEKIDKIFLRNERKQKLKRICEKRR